MEQRLHADDGATVVDFSLIAPLVFGLVGMALFVGWAFVNMSLLDRAGEIIAREVSIHGDAALALDTAEDSTPIVDVDTVQVSTTSGTPLVGRPAAGEVFEVTVTATLTNPAAPLVRLISGAGGEGASLTIQQTLQGVGQ